MRILSLFDGMACGMLAFRRADVPVDRYVAYEIDKYAIQVSKHNFPMIEQRGDVFQADFTEFEGFDAVVGGSPCTYWSIAQTKNRETEAHGIGWELFQQYVRAIREAKPRFFIYENNKSMASAIKEEISNAFGFEPIMINSALVSAQNRQRYYWVGIRQEDGTYRKANIEQPIDRGIVLRDVLDDYQSRAQTAAEPINTYNDGGEKSRTLMAGYYKYGMATMVTNEGFKGGTTGVAEPVAGRIVGRRINEEGHRDDYNESLEHIQRYEVNENPQKTNCLTTVQKDNMVAEPVEVRGMSYELAECNDKDESVIAKLDMPGSHDILTRVYSSNGKSPTITAMGGGNTEPKVFSDTTKVVSKTPTPHYVVKDGMITIKGKSYPIKLPDGEYIIRKLTVSECKRLQTVPEDYDMTVISNSQAYKCLGNGWTVDVIAHLIEGVMKELEE